MLAVEPAIKKQAGLWSKALPWLPWLQEAAGGPLGNEWLALAPPRLLGHQIPLQCAAVRTVISVP